VNRKQLNSEAAWFNLKFFVAHCV